MTRLLSCLFAACLLFSACAHPTPATTPTPPSGPGTQVPGDQWSRHSAASIAELRRDLDAVFDAPVYAQATWGIVVESLATGQTLYERNRAKLMMPASNMKIVTMAAAAETLGWDFRFETRLVTDAPVEDGTLAGDLIAVGAGDPTINARGGARTRVFDAWADRLTALGIRRIAGRIVGDDNAFEDVELGAGWAWDYLAYGYAAPCGALQYNENLVQVQIAAGPAAGAPAIVTVDPADEAVTLVNEVVTGPADARPEVTLRRGPAHLHTELRGVIPVGGPALQRTVAVENPTLFFVRALRNRLIARGIAVDGGAVDIDQESPAPAPAASGSAPVASGLSRTLPTPVASGFSRTFRTLLTHTSAPLSEIGTVLMKVSQNLYAETFLKTLGLRSSAAHGSTAAGRDVEEHLLASWGIPPGTYWVADGSGLSRYNYLNAGMIARLLRRMHDDPRHREPFLETLPIAGRDGTLAGRMKGTPAAENVRAKTGTISNVRSLSGYLKKRAGEPLVFSIIANDFLAPSATIDYGADLALEVLAIWREEK